MRRLLLELRGVGLRVHVVHASGAHGASARAADARVTLASDCSARVIAPSSGTMLPVAPPIDESETREWAMAITEHVVALTGDDVDEPGASAPASPEPSTHEESEQHTPARKPMEYADDAGEESSEAPANRHAAAGRIAPSIRGGALVWLGAGGTTAMIRGDLRIAVRRGVSIDLGAFGAAPTQSSTDVGTLTTRPVVATLGASWRRALRPPRLDLLVGARVGGGVLHSESVSIDEGTSTSRSALFVAATEGALVTRLGGAVSLVTGVELGVLYGRTLAVPSAAAPDPSEAPLVPTRPVFTGISVGLSVDFGVRPAPASASRVAQQRPANDS